MAAETVIVTPLFLLLVVVAVGLGRLSTAHTDVDGAARSAARAASAERSVPRAVAAARTAAASSLAVGGVTCRHLTVAVDTSAFRAGGTVTVNVACDVDLSDLSLLPFPATESIQSHFASPIDIYRGAQP